MQATTALSRISTSTKTESSENEKENSSEQAQELRVDSSLQPRRMGIYFATVTTIALRDCWSTLTTSNCGRRLDTTPFARDRGALIPRPMPIPRENVGALGKLGRPACVLSTIGRDETLCDAPCRPRRPRSVGICDLGDDGERAVLGRPLSNGMRTSPRPPIVACDPILGDSSGLDCARAWPLKPGGVRVRGRVGLMFMRISCSRLAGLISDAVPGLRSRTPLITDGDTRRG